MKDLAFFRIKKRNICSSEDLERCYFQYQTESLLKSEYIQKFCLKNKVLGIFFEYVRRLERPLYSLFGRSCNRSRLGQACDGTCFGRFFENSAGVMRRIGHLHNHKSSVQ